MGYRLYDLINDECLKEINDLNVEEDLYIKNLTFGYFSTDTEYKDDCVEIKIIFRFEYDGTDYEINATDLIASDGSLGNGKQEGDTNKLGDRITEQDYIYMDDYRCPNCGEDYISIYSFDCCN